MRKILNTRRKLLTILTALTLSLFTFSSSAFAATVNSELETLSTSAMASSGTIAQDYGQISNQTKKYTINISSSGYYSLTMYTSKISGDGSGVWTVFQKSGKSPLVDVNVNGSFSRRFYLTSGTYYLQLSCYNTAYSFSYSIQ